MLPCKTKCLYDWAHGASTHSQNNNVYIYTCIYILNIAHAIIAAHQSVAECIHFACSTYSDIIIVCTHSIYKYIYIPVSMSMSKVTDMLAIHNNINNNSVYNIIYIYICLYMESNVYILYMF